MTIVRAGTVLRQLPPDLGQPLVAGGGYHAFATAIPSPPRTREGVHVVLQLDRAAVWTIDGRSFLPVRAGEIALIAPGCSFRGAGGVDYPNAHAWLDLRPARRDGGDPAPFTTAERIRFAKEVQKLGTTVLRGSPGLASASREYVACLNTQTPPATLRAVVALLLARVAEAVHAPQVAPRDRVVDAALAHIDATLDDGRLIVPTLAATTRLSPTVFTRRFRAATGWSPAAWVAFRRTWRAAERLRAGRESVTTVAHALGFPSSQHLATCIRRHLGVTAGALRDGSADLPT